MSSILNGILVYMVVGWFWNKKYPRVAKFSKPVVVFNIKTLIFVEFFFQIPIKIVKITKG